MNLGELEELTLLAVKQLGEGAYGVPIHEALEEAGRKVAIGATYITLNRLEDKGYIEGRQSVVVSERGGKSKRFFRLTGKGLNALNEAEMRRVKLRGGVLGGLA